MFSFFSKKNPWTTQSAMENWLKQLPTGDAQQAQMAIMELLEDYFKSEDRERLDYFPAIWLMCEKVEIVIQELIRQYLHNHKSSLNIEKVVWESLFGVTKRLAHIYEPILDIDPQKLLKNLKAEGLARSIAYYIHYKALQSKIRLFRFERWVPAEWTLLHRSFSLAEETGVQLLPIALFEADEDQKSIVTRIEVEYIHLLLLQLLNIGSFEPAHIEQAHLWLTMCAADVTVERTPNAEGFVVDLHHPEGLIRASKIAAEVVSNAKNSRRFINTYTITRRLEQEIETTREQLAEMVSDSVALESTLNLLDKWHGLWNHNDHSWVRKGDREKVLDTEIWVINDWQAMCQAALPIQGSESQVSPPIPVYTVADQCRILDKSRSGYGMIGMRNESRPFKLGMLLLIYDEIENEWALCILRRLKKLNLDQVEIGAEIMGRDIRSMQPSIEKKQSSYQVMDGYEINVLNGEESDDDSVPALYIRPQEGTKAGNCPSLVMLKRHYYGAGQKLNIRLDMGAFIFTLGIPVEEKNDWIWCRFNAVQDTSSS